MKKGRGHKKKEGKDIKTKKGGHKKRKGKHQKKVAPFLGRHPKHLGEIVDCLWFNSCLLHILTYVASAYTGFTVPS